MTATVWLIRFAEAGIGGLVACVGLAQLWALTLDERDARRRDGTPQ